MSAVVAFRQRVMDTIKDTIPEINEVDWYNGMFDEDDIAAWTLRTPCSIVSCRSSAPAKSHTTGELIVTVNVLVVTIIEDRIAPRDADEKVWNIIETIADLAHNNRWGDPRAAEPCKIGIDVLSIPELRREGVAIGITKWETTLTIGRNKVEEREYIYYNGERVAQTPASVFLGETITAADQKSERHVSEFSADGNISDLP